LRVEPGLDQAGLIAVLEREYGIAIRALHFYPTDFTGYNYVVECLEGERYFLKLRVESERQSYVAGSAEFHLALTDQLFTSGILSQIPHPLKTRRGDLQAGYGDYRLALYNFISGRTVGFDGVTGQVKARLARLVGVLHRSISTLKLTNLFVERFQAVFAEDLIAMLAGLEAIGPGEREGKWSLRETLLPRRSQILAYLLRLKELQREVVSINKPQVVCHTDLHGGNLLVDDSGNLFIMDWENAMIAPPEHDLFFFAGEDDFWEVFWPNYKSEFSAGTLDSRLLGFYCYRRGLEDLSEFMARILSGDGDEARDLADLHWIPGCVDELAQVEARIANIGKRFM